MGRKSSLGLLGLESGGFARFEVFEERGELGVDGCREGS
jgi:hypothetical protein